jgi:hypothetical protein
MHRRISLFVNVPVKSLDDLAFKQKLEEIGRS